MCVGGKKKRGNLRLVLLTIIFVIYLISIIIFSEDRVQKFRRSYIFDLSSPLYIYVLLNFAI